MIPALEIPIKGIILGLTVSMPLGPVGIILKNRTLKRGCVSGFFSGLGLAAADTILAILAGLSFTFIIAFVKEERFILSLVAGIVIIVVGLKILSTNPVKDFRNKEKANKSSWRDFYSVFALSITNPYTVLIFVAFFSGVHAPEGVKPEFVPFLLIPGVFIGTITWWFFLSYFVGRFKKRIRLRSIVTINRVSGITIITIGIILLLSVFTTIKL